MNQLLPLAYEFFLTGLFAIGGGMATVPFLRDMAQEYPWFTSAELTSMIAVSESTPGPIGINMATFAGFRAAGLIGAAVSTLSLVFPSIVIILLISRAMKQFQDNKLVQDAFYCLRPASAGMITGTILSIFADIAILPGGLPYWQVLLAFVLITGLRARFQKLHPVLFILGGAGIGILFSL